MPGHTLRTRSAPTAPPAARSTTPDPLIGLLGIAVALVAVVGVWSDRAPAAVDMMLVLAGYLLGRRLLGSSGAHRDTATVAREVSSFARRVLPALVAVVATAGAVTVWLQPQTRWETFADQALASLAFIQNVELARSSGPYAPAGEAVSPLQHLWAVSVLVQVCVLVLAAAWLIAAAIPARHRRAVLVAVVLALTAASLGYAVAVYGVDPAPAYYDTLARTWQVTAGVSAAALTGQWHQPRWLRATSTVTAVAVIVAVGVLTDGGQEFPGPLALLTVAATLLAISSADGGDRAPLPVRTLAAPALVTLGAAAYALYLWHWPLLIFWLTHSEHDSAGLADGLAVIVIAAGLAVLTTRWLQQPLAASPGGAVPGRLRTTALGTAVALLAVTVAIGSVGWRQHTDTIRANGGELLRLSAIDYPGARALVDNQRVPKLPVRPSVLEASDDVPATTIDGCISDFANSAVTKCVYGDPRAGRTIALVGGSHSEHWLTALSSLGVRHGFAVTTYLKMGCPLNTDEVPRIAGSDNPYPGCRDWVAAVLDTLGADRPDFVFTPTTRPRTDAPGDYVPDSYLGIWDALAALRLPTLGIRDTPWMYRDGMMFSPVDCLAEDGDPQSCGLPRSEVLSDYNPTMDHLGRYPGIIPLDLSDAVCRPDYCRAAEGNVLIYHDAHHLSATYVRTMTDELGRQLGAATGWW